MEQKFQCNRCGKECIKRDITYIACEGLFCRICTYFIYEELFNQYDQEFIFEGPFEYEDGLNAFLRE